MNPLTLLVLMCLSEATVLRFLQQLKAPKLEFEDLKIDLESRILLSDVHSLRVTGLFHNSGWLYSETEPNASQKLRETVFCSFFLRRLFYNEGEFIMNSTETSSTNSISILSRHQIVNDGIMRLAVKGFSTTMAGWKASEIDIYMSALKEIVNHGVLLFIGVPSLPAHVSLRSPEINHRQNYMLFNAGTVCLQHASWMQDLWLLGEGSICLLQDSTLILSNRFMISNSQTIVLKPGKGTAALIYRWLGPNSWNCLNVFGLQEYTYVMFDPPFHDFQWLDGLLRFLNSEGQEILVLRVGHGYEKQDFHFTGSYITSNKKTSMVDAPSCLC